MGDVDQHMIDAWISFWMTWLSEHRRAREGTVSFQTGTSYPDNLAGSLKDPAVDTAVSKNELKLT
jgi:hypothetical protein